MKRFFVFIIALTLFASCNNSNNQQSGDQSDSLNVAIDSTDTAIVRTDLTQVSKAILKEFKDKNYEAIAQYIHPDEGVRFSPYAYIRPDTDVHLSQADFLSAVNSEEEQIWGAADGTGDDIKLTAKEYFDRYVYDVDFLEPETFSVNESIASGNSINNQEEIYPGTQFTESHFSGFEEKYSGMDWRALRLIFKQVNGNYYLVGVVHDEWTI